MEEFILRGKQGNITLQLEKVSGFPKYTSHFGGYDAEGIVEIISGNYYVRGALWLTTGDVYSFYNQLKKAYDSLSGKATFCNSPHVNLEITTSFNKKGHVVISGYFIEHAHLDNELKFEIESDQSYFESTLRELEKIVQKYGGLKGI